MPERKQRMKRKLNHGGDWAGFKEEFGYDPLDFSMNVNPMGMPDAVRKAIADSAADAWKYPDPLCRRLVDAIAEYEHCSAEHVLCGCGAADIIYRAVLAEAPKRALVTAPTFGEYEEALSLTDCEVISYLLSENNDFGIGEDILKYIDETVDMVFLCEPNNPTGVTTDRKLLEKIIEKCGESGTRLIVDECFNDFLENPEMHSLKGYIEKSDRLIILKALTKNFSMAGVRLGYCLCSDRIALERMRKSGQPWPVSVLAQNAGIAAFGCADRLADLGRVTAVERRYLLSEMRKIGLEPVESEANYILFKAETGLESYLRNKGILIRNCSNYRGLGEGWFRTAVRTRKENEKLIEEMRSWANEKD